jgi:uncharacterized repeat protein (TIGR03803 family)
MIRVQTGSYPYGSLVQGSDGNFYGMTSEGGAFTIGTVFKLDVSELTPPPAPALAVQRTGTNLVVTWPSASAPGFTLQSNANLRLSNVWATVGQSAVSNASNYSVTLPLPGTKQFFRLQKP